jgi:hypothetical protein
VAISSQSPELVVKRAADSVPASLQVSPRLYALRALALADADAVAADTSAAAAVREYIAVTDCMADEVPAALADAAVADAITLQSSRLAALSDAAYSSYLAKCAERRAAVVDADQLSPAKSINLVNKIAKTARAKVAACQDLTDDEKHVLDVLRLVPYNKLVLSDCLLDYYGRVVDARGVAVYGVRGVLASIRAKVAAEKRLERAEKRGIRAAEKVNRDYQAATSDMANKEAAEKEAAEKRARALADAAAVLVDGGVEPELAAVLAAKLVA